MRAGSLQLTAGIRLAAIDLGAAVTAGVGQLMVSTRPRVSVVCTGDELRAPGEPLGPGEIHNSNAPMLVGLAATAGALPTPATRLPDDRAATEAGIKQALEQADLLIISGGVSVGPHDHVKPALATLGVKRSSGASSSNPASRRGLGEAPDGTLVFGLPGNPVSAVVTFSLFVAPALAALQGGPAPGPHTAAALGTAVNRNPRRDQAIRVRLELGADGLTAFPNGPQGSHILTSLVGADALAMIPAGDGEVPAGSKSRSKRWLTDRRPPRRPNRSQSARARPRPDHHRRRQRRSPPGGPAPAAARPRGDRLAPQLDGRRHDGAVRSVQSAKLTVDERDLERIWTPANLENLARTYWRFLSRVTLGLVRVVYGADSRSVVLLSRPLTLLRFDKPEYTIEDDHGERPVADP